MSKNPMKDPKSLSDDELYTRIKGLRHGAEREALLYEWRFRDDLRTKKQQLEIDDIETKLSLNRLERAKADLSSRATEPLPNHHCVNHEK